MDRFVFWAHIKLAYGVRGPYPLIEGPIRAILPSGLKGKCMATEAHAEIGPQPHLPLIANYST